MEGISVTPLFHVHNSVKKIQSAPRSVLIDGNAPADMGDMIIIWTKTKTIMSDNKGAVLACGGVASSVKNSVERCMNHYAFALDSKITCYQHYLHQSVRVYF